MRCTRCLNVHLVAEEFRGQMIETCPRCHGVWLSRQDFDLLTSGQATAYRAPPPAREDYRAPRDHHHDDPRYRHSSHDSSGRLPIPGRRRSWLSDLFD